MQESPLSSPVVRYLWLAIGWLSFALGTAGIFLPLLPTVPFYLLTLFCFSKGSQRLHQWFVNHNLYKQHVLPFLAKKALTWKAKCSIMASVTFTMGLAFYLANDYPIGKTVIGAMWIIHVLVMVFVVNTDTSPE